MSSLYLLLIDEYEVDDDDHCETPEAAYENIQKVLELIANKLNKTPADLIIYDPFYCQGSMVKRMQHCGFHNVYNKKEDFYVKQRTQTVPDYDVLVTNPPYSGSHMRKLIQFVNASDKPYCLLVPNYVYMKDYYQAILSPTEVTWEPGAVEPKITKSAKPPADNFYIVPNKRYLYTTPNGRRQGKSAKYTSPFPTFWYCNIGPSSTLGTTKSFLSELKRILTNTNSNRLAPAGAPNTGTTSASSYCSVDPTAAESTSTTGGNEGPTACTNTYKIANSVATLPMEVSLQCNSMQYKFTDILYNKHEWFICVVCRFVVTKTH